MEKATAKYEENFVGYFMVNIFCESYEEEKVRGI